MATLFITPFVPAFGVNGTLSPSATLTFYAPDTTTLVPVYTDDTLVTELANPVISDTGGQFAAIYLRPDATYRVVLKTAAGGPIADIDPYPESAIDAAGNPTSVGFDLTTNMTAVQRNATLNFSNVQNVIAPVTSITTAAWTGNQNVWGPAGLYRLESTWQLPGAAVSRTNALAIRGQGTGEIFARALNAGSILFGTSTTTPVVQYIPDAPNTGQGTLEFSRFRIEGNTTAAVVDFGSLYGQSRFSQTSIFQSGAGDGFRSRLSNTIEIDHVYSLNADWNTVFKVGRTGAGFRVTQSLAGGTGLTTIRKTTSRGFQYGYVLGDGINPLYSHKISDFECSVVQSGVWVRAAAAGTLIVDGYLEGGDGGFGILDDGRYTKIHNNLIFGGFSVGIDASNASAIGADITGNLVSAGSRPNTIVIRVASSGAGGGAGKTVTGNTVAFPGSGGSIVGVVGMQISGIDPRITWNGNVFDPRGPWVGGAGTMKINNISTSSDGTLGTGVYGMGMAEDIAGNIESPHLGRGAINIKVDPTVLINARIVAGVLSLGQLSAFTLTLSVAANITSFTAPNLPDKTFTIHCTGGANLPTFVNGALLKLAGSINFTPTAAGCWISFQIKPGGVAWETGRVAY